MDYTKTNRLSKVKNPSKQEPPAVPKVTKPWNVKKAARLSCNKVNG